MGNTRVYINPALAGKASHEIRTNDGPVKIVVTPERKLRVFAYKSPTQDEWPILYRRDVPNLTDAEWYDAPGPEWELVEEYDREDRS